MKKILFCATTPLSYGVFKPIHLRLKRDKRIQVWFTANHNPGNLYGTVGLRNEKIINKYHAMVRRFDMCICPSFFFTRKNADVKVQTFHGCSLKNRAVHRKALAYDKLFLIGPYMRQKFITTWNLHAEDERFVNIGMPKLDVWFNGSIDRGRLMEKLKLDPKLPTVIYAPTRTSYDSSSLELFGRHIISSVAEMPVNFLVKLHDRSYRQWKPKMKEDWMDILDRYNNHPRVRSIFDYDITPYLYISDLLISDFSSVVNEFALLDRPMVLIHAPDHMDALANIERRRGVAASDLMDWGQSVGHLVQDMEDLQTAVTRGLEHPDEKRDIRSEFAEKFFFNPGGATEKAVAETYKLLGIEPPSSEL